MLNFIEVAFLNFAVSVTLTGFLINHFEKYVPKIVLQTYLYGCFSHKGEKAPIVKAFEIPKSLFRHYYLFSATFSGVLLTYMVYVYGIANEVNWQVHEYLKLLLGFKRPQVCAAAAVIAMVCLFLQCLRRLYETYCIQVFAKSSRMHMFHYIAGVFHYFGCIVTIIGSAPLFAGDLQSIKYMDTYTAIVLLPAIIIFAKGWLEQSHANLILANLRKDDKMENIISEEHKMPKGGWFEIVSSPHRLTEVMMYTSLLLLIPTRTFSCIYLWVIGNQIQTALQAHWWYLSAFKNYPRNRYVIFPFVF